MIEIGRVCVKTAGRDSGRFCVVIDKIDDKFVMIAGETRRKKCNIKHLEPTKHKIDIKKGAKTEEAMKELIKLGIVKEKIKGKK